MASSYNSLGQPPDNILSRLELSTIMFRRLSYRLEAVRNSEQGEQICSTPVEFQLGNGEDEVVLTDLASDFVIPLWAEFKSWSNLGNPVWIYLPTVNLSMLAQQRVLGKYACSFYGPNAREVRFKSSLYGNEIPLVTYTAPIVHVYYAQDVPFPAREDSTIDLPNNLVTMVMYDTLVSALPLMITNGSKLLLDQPQLAPQLKAWEQLYQHYQMEKAEFEHLFEKWRRESRGSHRPRKRPDVLQGLVGTGMPTLGYYQQNRG